MSTHTATADTDAAAFADRVQSASLGWMEAMSIHVGLQLGWYTALAEADAPLTATALAEATGSDARYAREWLEMQAAFAILTSPDPAPGEVRRYALPAGAAEALLDGSSLAYLGALPRMLAASGARMPELLHAYRSGGGVGWSAFGADAREAQADLNRPWLARVPEVLAQHPRLHALLARPGARVADVGMGAGWSSIALAQAYPELRVEGFDVDEPSVRMARENAVMAGVADRVRFRVEDAAHLDPSGGFDAAFAFECLHDMPHPVAVLAAVRDAVRPDGMLVVMDEAVEEAFAPPTGEVERLMYGYSLFVCLPDGLSHPGSAGTGTVLRPPLLRRYAAQAGLRVEVLGEPYGFWRFYALRRPAR